MTVTVDGGFYVFLTDPSLPLLFCFARTGHQSISQSVSQSISHLSIWSGSINQSGSLSVWSVLVWFCQTVSQSVSLSVSQSVWSGLIWFCQSISRSVCQSVSQSPARPHTHNWPPKNKPVDPKPPTPHKAPQGHSGITWGWLNNP